LGDRTLLPVRSLMKIFIRICRSVRSEQDIDEIRASIHLKGITLADHSLNYNTLIRKYSEPHLREGMTVLVHSFSSVVFNVIQHACERGLRVKVITTEAQPSHTSALMKQKCIESGIEC
jgi:translation initiation factor 2B subunit (eIF-2B alpha/beta/delta family)